MRQNYQKYPKQPNSGFLVNKKRPKFAPLDYVFGHALHNRDRIKAVFNRSRCRDAPWSVRKMIEVSSFSGRSTERPYNKTPV